MKPMSINIKITGTDGLSSDAKTLIDVDFQTLLRWLLWTYIFMLISENFEKFGYKRLLHQNCSFSVSVPNTLSSVPKKGIEMLTKPLNIQINLNETKEKSFRKISSRIYSKKINYLIPFFLKWICQAFAFKYVYVGVFYYYIFVMILTPLIDRFNFSGTLPMLRVNIFGPLQTLISIEVIIELNFIQWIEIR